MLYENQMLPTEITDLIWEFHDEFDLIGKTKRLNFIIETGFRTWLSCKDYFGHEFEFPPGSFRIWQIDRLFYCSWYRDTPIYPLPYEWLLYISCYRNAEKDLVKATTVNLDLMV